MDFLRAHWPDIGIILALILASFLFISHATLNTLQIILLVSFISLLLHEYEEYRVPGYFPRMINKTLFKSSKPDRYPLNSNTALWVNMFFGWTIYAIALIFAERAIWFCIISVMINVGNIIVHTFVFNIKGRTVYNPGMLTSLLLFLPVSSYFFWYIYENNLATNEEVILWAVIGFIFSVLLIIGSIEVGKDKKTSYIFKQ